MFSVFSSFEVIKTFFCVIFDKCIILFPFIIHLELICVYLKKGPSFLFFHGGMHLSHPLKRPCFSSCSGGPPLSCFKCRPVDLCVCVASGLLGSTAGCGGHPLKHSAWGLVRGVFRSRCPGVRLLCCRCTHRIVSTRCCQVSLLNLLPMVPQGFCLPHLHQHFILSDSRFPNPERC